MCKNNEKCVKHSIKMCKVYWEMCCLHPVMQYIRTHGETKALYIVWKPCSRLKKQTTKHTQNQYAFHKQQYLSANVYALHIHFTSRSITKQSIFTAILWVKKICTWDKEGGKK